jgi:YD repeat-containing protein
MQISQIMKSAEALPGKHYFAWNAGSWLGLGCLVLAFIITMGSAMRVYGQTPKIHYSYDDLGRLIRVVNQSNECAHYDYDSVGNILSIRRSVNCLQPPVISTISQEFARAGESVCMTITGSNFSGAAVTTDNPDVRITRVRVTDTGIELCLAISPSTATTGARIMITTPGGTTVGVIAISSRTVVVTQHTTIGETDRTLENAAVTVEGANVLTINGTHQLSSLTLRNGAVLTHNSTTANQAGKLDLTVTGRVQVDGSSRIDVSARGYLGGWQPGNSLSQRGMTVGFQPGSTDSAGASYGGIGGIAGGIPNPTYGDFGNPTDPGSGGGAFFAAGRGGNGGGLLRIKANELNLDGRILADGGAAVCCAAGGSGGGIRIEVATLRGTGQITANGGNAATAGDTNGGGGGGRIAVYYQNLLGFDLTRITATGGVSTGTSPSGGAGTVYIQGPQTPSGELVVDNGGRIAASLSTPVSPSAPRTVQALRVRRGAKANLAGLLAVTENVEVSSSAQLVIASGTFNLSQDIRLLTGSELVLSGVPLRAATATIAGGSTLSHSAATAKSAFKVDLNVATLNIEAGSRIDVSARGYLGGWQQGNPFSERGMTLGFQSGSPERNGGSYGGLGGNPGGTTPNSVYGDFRNPGELGSGGAGFWVNSRGGNGGGLVRITANELNLDGSITANGGAAVCCASGGSGGGIRIDVGTLRGTGQIAANGGSAASDGDSNGGGGGGRVAVYYQSIAGFDVAKITAFGGIAAGQASHGGAGTVYLQGPATQSGELIVDNNHMSTWSVSTPITNPAGGQIALTNMRVRRGAKIRVETVLNVASTLEVSGGVEYISTNRTVAGSINVSGNSVITHFPTTAAASFKVDLSAGDMTIDSSSRIEASSRGYLGGWQPGNASAWGEGMTLGFRVGSTGTSGGSYGGRGGSSPGGLSNAAYGDLASPNEVGSGGAAFYMNTRGGNGGGLIHIVAQRLLLNGSILANGGAGVSDGGGGSGGGIRIETGSIGGTGQIRADGAPAAGTGSAGGGGGGRVAIAYRDGGGFNFSNVTAIGGAGASGGGQNGQNGTVQIQQSVLGP